MRCGIRKVPKVGELAVNFRGDGGHLIAQPKIQGEVRTPAPVVLHITAQHTLANITRGKCTDNASLESRWNVGQKILYVAELPDAVGIRKSSGLQQHALGSETKFNGVCATIDECVVVHLERIPVIQIRRESADAASQKRPAAADLDLSSGSTRKRGERIIGGHGINCFEALVVAYRFVVKPETNGIDEGRREAVGFFDGNNLSGASAAEEDVIHSVGRGIWGPIVEVGSEKAIFIRELMIDPGGNEVFVYNLLTSKGERGEIVAPSNGVVLDRVKSKILLGSRVYGHGMKVRRRGTSGSTVGDVR